jgi:four helix bundle protein
MRDFRHLKVWHKAPQLTLAVYKATRRFPKDEQYGLTSQIRRSCESMPANISEGCGRSSIAELARFLEIAMGSASELEYHLLLTRDLLYLDTEEYDSLARELMEIKRMLVVFVKKLNADG